MSRILISSIEQLKNIYVPGKPLPDKYYVKLKATSRHGIIAKPGFVTISCDFKSQELAVAGVLSLDRMFLNAFEADPVMVVDGVKYDNPDTDLHTINAMNCFPELFKDKPKHEWVNIAKDDSLIAAKGNARFYGKILGFGIIYQQSPQAMAALNYRTVEECTEWVKNHKRTFKDFHRWSEDYTHIGNTLGWARNPLGRIRWVS